MLLFGTKLFIDCGWSEDRLESCETFESKELKFMDSLAASAVLLLFISVIRVGANVYTDRSISVHSISDFLSGEFS